MVLIVFVRETERRQVDAVRESNKSTAGRQWSGGSFLHSGHHAHPDQSCGKCE